LGRVLKKEIEYHKNLEINITTDKESFSLTLGDYHNIMYPNAADSGYVSVATKKQNQWQQHMYKTTDWYKYIELETNCYLSVNTFYIPQRQTKAVRHLNVFYVDLDIYSMGVSTDDVLQGIDFLVDTERILRPTFVISSGRGLYVLWKIEDVPGYYKKTKNMYNYIQDYLVETFGDLGADTAAKDIARVLRVPGTRNTKNNQRVEIIQYNEQALYTMSMFRDFIDPFEEYSPSDKTEKTKVKKTKKIAYMYNAYTLHKARATDIEKLCELRDYEMTGQRDTFLYIYHYYMLLIHQDEAVALYKTLNLNDSFSEPLPEKEVKSYVKSSVRAYNEHQKDRTKGYNFKNDTLIKKLAITDHEMTQLKTIITKDLKYERNNKRRTPRNSEGLTSRQAQKKETYDKIIELHLAGLKQVDIAHKVGVSKGLVSRYVKKYKETL